MSTRYWKQMQQTKEGYTNAYMALYQYCSGRPGKWFNPKRQVLMLLEKIPDFDKDGSDNHKNPSFIISQMLPHLHNIDPTSKLAAVFNVIAQVEAEKLRAVDKSGEGFFSDINTKSWLLESIKLNKAQNEETVVKLLKRYSAPWIVRLFTGELFNKDIKTVRTALRQYKVDKNYSSLIVNVSKVQNTNNVLRDIVSFSTPIKQKQKREVAAKKAEVQTEVEEQAKVQHELEQLRQALGVILKEYHHLLSEHNQLFSEVGKLSAEKFAYLNFETIPQLSKEKCDKLIEELGGYNSTLRNKISEKKEQLASEELKKIEAQRKEAERVKAEEQSKQEAEQRKEAERVKAEEQSKQEAERLKEVERIRFKEEQLIKVEHRRSTLLDMLTSKIQEVQTIYDQASSLKNASDKILKNKEKIFKPAMHDFETFYQGLNHNDLNKLSLERLEVLASEVSKYINYIGANNILTLQTLTAQYKKDKEEYKKELTDQLDQLRKKTEHLVKFYSVEGCEDSLEESKALLLQIEDASHIFDEPQWDFTVNVEKFISIIERSSNKCTELWERRTRMLHDFQDIILEYGLSKQKFQEIRSNMLILDQNYYKENKENIDNLVSTVESTFSAAKDCRNKFGSTDASFPVELKKLSILAINKAGEFLRNNVSTQFQEHMDVVDAMTKKILENIRSSSTPRYAISKLFEKQDCHDEKSIKAKLNQMAKDTGVMFNKEMLNMEIFFGTGPSEPSPGSKPPPPDLNYNFVEPPQQKVRMDDSGDSGKKRENQDKLEKYILSDMKKIKVVEMKKRVTQELIHSLHPTLKHLEPQIEQKVNEYFRDSNVAMKPVSSIVAKLSSELKLPEQIKVAVDNEQQERLLRQQKQNRNFNSNW